MLEETSIFSNLWQSKWQITTFSQKICVFALHLLETTF